MDSAQFVDQLAAENEAVLERLKSSADIPADDPKFDVIPMLRVALRNEVEAAEISARWMPTTLELDAKLGFGRQVGDESRHYRLIEKRLSELGDKPEFFNPLEQGYTPLFKFLSQLRTTVERVAAGQFTREAIALIKNVQFIELCKKKGDAETAKLYEEIIQPDETFHQQLGRDLLIKYATTPDSQEAARRAAKRTLDVAEELQGVLLKGTGVHHAPGC